MNKGKMVKEVLWLLCTLNTPGVVMVVERFEDGKLEGTQIATFEDGTYKGLKDLDNETREDFDSEKTFMFSCDADDKDNIYKDDYDNFIAGKYAPECSVLKFVIPSISEENTLLLSKMGYTRMSSTVIGLGTNMDCNTIIRERIDLIQADWNELNLEYIQK